MFATNPVSRSTPHIYVSMLAFWPRSRSLANCYIQRTRGLAEVGGTGTTRRQLALLSVLNVNVRHRVLCVAFSPDGMRIASASLNVPVHVWDTKNEQMVLERPGMLLNGINSVAFSPDGA